MQVLLLLTAIACVYTLVVASKVVEMDQSKDEDEVLQQILRQLIAEPNTGSGGNNAQLESFSWKSCGGQYVEIKSFSLTPDPLTFPCELTISADVNVTMGIKEPLKVSLDVAKEEFGIYIHVPCIDNVGSCTYDGICDDFAKLQSNCPQQLKDIGIDCKCPINPKNYSLKGAKFSIPKEQVISGKYHVIAKLLEGNVEAACIDLHFQIKEER